MNRSAGAAEPSAAGGPQKKNGSSIGCGGHTPGSCCGHAAAVHAVSCLLYHVEEPSDTKAGCRVFRDTCHVLQTVSTAPSFCADKVERIRMDP